MANSNRIFIVELRCLPCSLSGANAQSTLDRMRMMDGNGNNKTDSSQLIGGIEGMDSSDPTEVNDSAQANMSMLPFKLGVLTMPMMRHSC